MKENTNMKSLTKKVLGVALVATIAATMAVGLTACNKGKPGYTPVTAQADIFTELNSKTADAGILDFTMASYLLSTGSALANNVQMISGIEYDAESYGIAFRKGSLGLCDKVNSALAALEQTEVKTIATKYGLSENVLPLKYTAKTDLTAADNADFEYIKGKKTFIVGYTLNAPMAIKASDNSLSGFDIELPKAVIAKINETLGTSIEVKFQLIEWANKETELSSKTIDCIWNGMTITDQRKANMTISTPYLLNKQVVLIRKADASKYTTKESLKKARVVAEDGSAGADIAKAIFA
ncbi:MAG: transporter substrate-binding domain-containing protein [Clostridia bacterium]